MFSTGLALLETRHDKELLRLTLSWILLSENGLSLAELLELTSNDDGLLPLTSNDAGLLPLLYDLESCEIVCNVNWIIKFIHRDVSIIFSRLKINIIGLSELFPFIVQNDCFDVVSANSFDCFQEVDLCIRNAQVSGVPVFLHSSVVFYKTN